MTLPQQIGIDRAALTFAGVYDSFRSWIRSFGPCTITTATIPITGPAEVCTGGRAGNTSSLDPHTSPVRPGEVFFCRSHVKRRMSSLDFSKLQGLVPAVVQDADTREVLMVGFMNEEALEVTRRTGFTTFFSRTRNKLWTKGETSGNRLEVVRLLVDCDDDTVLVLARCKGDGVVCHTGERTCFFRELA